MATKLGSAYVDIGANLTPLETGLNGVHGAFSKSLKSALSLERVMNRLACIGTVGLVYTLGRALQTAFKDGTKDAIEFESAMAHINTVLDDSAKHYLPKFRKGIEDISLSLGKDVKDLSASMYDIISARIPPEHALYVLSQATELAVANQAELRSVTQAVLTILKAYNMEISDTGKITDQLQTAIKFGRMEMTELAPVLGDVTSAAAILNIRLEDVLGSLATMTRAGFNPKKAVTSMRRAFMAMSEDAELSAKIQADGFLSVLPIIEAMGQQQQKTITGGIRGFQTYAVAMQNWVDAGQDVKEMMKSDEAVAKALGIEMESSSMKIEQAAERSKKAWRDVGESFKSWKPFFLDFAAGTGKLLRTFTDSGYSGIDYFKDIFGATEQATEALMSYEQQYKAMAERASGANDEIGTGLGKQVQKIEDLIETEKKRYKLAVETFGTDKTGLEKLIELTDELVDVNKKRAAMGFTGFTNELLDAQFEARKLKNELIDLGKLSISDIKINTDLVDLSGDKEDFDDLNNYVKHFYDDFNERFEFIKDVIENTTDFMADRFSNAFDIITDRTMDGSKKINAIWENLVDALISELNRLLAKMIAVFAMKQLLSAFPGLGSFMGDIGTAITPPTIGIETGGSFSPVINNSVNAQFSRRDMGWIVNEGMRYNNNTRL